MRVEIRLDGPVRGKGTGRAFTTANGARIFTDEKTRKYEAQLRYAAQQVMAERSPLEGPLKVTIEARLQIPVSTSKQQQQRMRTGLVRPTIRPDTENIAKLMDGLNGIAWQDDKQIVEEVIRKVYADQPGLVIVVEPVEPGPLFA